MKYRNIIVLTILLFILSGCASSMRMTVGNLANILGGKKAKESKNILVESEINLVMVDELSAIVKLNQIMLDRMPITYEDSWPKLLNDYYKNTGLTDSKAKKRYDRCLDRLLRKDFYFYKIYNIDAYTGYVSKGSFLGAIGSEEFMEGCKILGKEYEHTKSVLSYIPFGCKCRYFNRSLTDTTPSSKICRRIRHDPSYRKCDFFNVSTETMLTKYLYRRSGVKHWADLPVEIGCFRAVRGEYLGTFKEVFYSLLDGSIRSQIQRIDDELAVDMRELEAVKGKLKYGKPSAIRKIYLEKKKNRLKKMVKNKQMLQNKLYERAISQLNVTYVNIRKAKKLKGIIDYINRDIGETLGVVANLTVKIVTDVSAISKTSFSKTLAEYPVLCNAGVFYKSRAFYRRRYGYVANKIISLPVTYFAILGYAISQKHQVSKYEQYVNALLKMEKKLKQTKNLNKPNDVMPEISHAKINNQHKKAFALKTQKTKTASEKDSITTQLQHIVLKKKVTKGDVAMLLVHKLQIWKLISSKKSAAVPGDVSNYPFKDEVMTVLKYNIRGLKLQYDLFTSTSLFKPKEYVTRKQLAFILEDILIKAAGNKKIATEHIGKESPFSDVSSSAAWFNAIMNCTEKGLMEAESNGKFKPNDYVDGKTLIAALTKLKSILKREGKS